MTEASRKTQCGLLVRSVFQPFLSLRKVQYYKHVSEKSLACLLTQFHLIYWRQESISNHYCQWNLITSEEELLKTCPFRYKSLTNLANFGSSSNSPAGGGMLVGACSTQHLASGSAGVQGGTTEYDTLDSSNSGEAKMSTGSSSANRSSNIPVETKRWTELDKKVCKTYYDRPMRWRCTIACAQPKRLEKKKKATAAAC